MTIKTIKIKTQGTTDSSGNLIENASAPNAAAVNIAIASSATGIVNAIKNEMTKAQSLYTRKCFSLKKNPNSRLISNWVANPMNVKTISSIRLLIV